MNPTDGTEKTNSMTAQRPGAVHEHFESLDPVEFARREKALLRKIDYRLMPCLLGMIVLKLVPLHRPGPEKGLLLTLTSYLDRNALPNARIQGIEDDLGLVGDQYNTAISVLFAGYIALQIPSNMLLTRVRPSIYLVSITAHKYAVE